MKYPEKEPEREQEVEARLQQLLQAKPDQSQLHALWYAFKKNNHRRGLILIAADAKRRFPAGPSFDERKSLGRLQNTAALKLSIPVLGPH